MELLLQQTARAQEKEEEDGPGPLLTVWELSLIHIYLARWQEAAK